MGGKISKREEAANLKLISAIFMIPILLIITFFQFMFWFFKFIGAVIINLIESSRNKTQISIPVNMDTILETVDMMDGQQFELFVIEILKNIGYTDVNGTKYTGDYGVDIMAYDGEIKVAIQCKRFNQNVSLKAIQEIVSGKTHYKCDKAIVITNSYYTKAAQELAFSNKVQLWDRDDLFRMVKESKTLSYDSVNPTI